METFTNETNNEKENTNNSETKFITNFSKLYTTRRVGKDFFDLFYSVNKNDAVGFDISSFLSTYVDNLRVADNVSIDINLFKVYIDAFSGYQIQCLISGTNFKKEHFEALKEHEEYKKEDKRAGFLSNIVYTLQTLSGDDAEEKLRNALLVFKDAFDATNIEDLLCKRSWMSSIVIDNATLDELIKVGTEKNVFSSKSITGYIFKDPLYAVEKYGDKIDVASCILGYAALQSYSENKINIDINKIVNGASSGKEKARAIRTISAVNNIAKTLSQTTALNALKEVIKEYLGLDTDKLDKDIDLSTIRALVRNNVQTNDTLDLCRSTYCISILREISSRLFPILVSFTTGCLRSKYKLDVVTAKILMAVLDKNKNLDNRASSHTIYSDFILSGFKFDEEFYKQLADENNSLFSDIFERYEKDDSLEVSLGYERIAWSNTVISSSIRADYFMYIAKRFLINNSIPKIYVESIYNKFIKLTATEENKESITYEFIRTQYVPESFKESIEENPKLLRALAVSGKCSKKEKAFAKLCSGADSLI